MKIGILSDLHIDIGNAFYQTLQDDVLYINAGDIANKEHYRNIFHEYYKRWNMFTIKGNHDYYDTGFPKSLLEDTKSITYISDGLRVAGATLWTNIDNPFDWVDYCRGLNDYAHYQGLTQEIYSATHKAHLNFLMSSDADIIVSHHLPSYKSVHPAYKYASTNCGFVTELYDLIYEMPNPPVLWIHGHTHTKCDYMINKTRVICHPRGYPYENPLYREYQPKIVEI